MKPGSSLASTLALCVGAFLLPGPAEAQRVGFAVGAGWYDPSGGDFSETEPGPGLDAAVRFGTGGRFPVALGVQWNAHDVPFSDDAYDIVSLFVEPRVELASRDRTAMVPFLAARLARVRQSIGIGGLDRRATGFGVGALAGLAVALGPAADLEGAVAIYRLEFGDHELGGATVPGSESGGNAFGVRLGLVLRP